MAILSFGITKDEFLSDRKTVTRRDWAESHFKMWVNMWEKDRHVHDAYDNVPRAGGMKIGEFRLTQRPYREKLSDMPAKDLIAEGGMCSTLDDFYEMIGKSPHEYVTVLRFKKLA